MPVVLHQGLYAWRSLRDEGIDVIDSERAAKSDQPKLEIGFLNMMPDRALRATESQFIRLIAAGAGDALIHVHPFQIAGLERGASARHYIDQNYLSFEAVTKMSFDGMVLTGANPGERQLQQESFFPYFEQVAHWADDCVPTVMCSCLASHAVLSIFYGIERIRCLPDKRWGVYPHRLTGASSPLVERHELSFEVPRSHVFEMRAEQLAQHGIQILAASEEADFHIGVSPDGFKWVYLQGHPEYDAISLLKEFKREIQRYCAGQRQDYPPYPIRYFNSDAVAQLDSFRQRLLSARKKGAADVELPEAELAQTLSNPWRRQGEILFHNWIEMMIRRKKFDDA